MIIKSLEAATAHSGYMYHAHTIWIDMEGKARRGGHRGSGEKGGKEGGAKT